MKKVILLIASMTAFAVMSQAQLVIENFDNSSIGFWSYKGTNAGSFSSTATLSGISGSTYSGYFDRATSDPYDNAVYTLTSTSLFTGTTVNALRNGTLKFKMNLATQANSGVIIKIKLQNTTLSGAPNYTGNSEYDATTTIGGSSNPYNWETLTFNMSSLSTAGTNITPVDQIVILFIPNSNSGDKFFFDNLQVFDPTATTTGTTTGTTTAFVSDNSVEDSKTNIYPNPSNGLTAIDYDTDNSSALKVTLNDMVGREIQAIENKSGAAKFNGYVDASSLEPGVYYVTFQQNGVSKRLKKLMVVR